MSKILEAIEELSKSLEGKTVTTDAYAEICNMVAKAVDALEHINPETKSSEDYILLKWGSFRGFTLTSDKGIELATKYSALGRSMSAMAQKDTDEQKVIMRQMIDECGGIIQNDWDGLFYTKQEAKDYIKEYGVERKQ